MVISIGELLKGLSDKVGQFLNGDSTYSLEWWEEQLGDPPTDVTVMNDISEAISSCLRAAWSADLGDAPQVLVTPKGVCQLPGDMMQHRFEFWSRVWDSPDTRASLSGVLDALRPLALSFAAEQLEPLTVGDLLGGARCFSSDTAVGVDHWAPRSLLDLPRDAVMGYTRLLNQCEQQMMWPTQILLSVIALLPKSVDCDRPICKCPTLYRVYCKSRNHDMEKWSQDRCNFWDTAVRGSSALQAALLRELGHEVARMLGYCSVGAHWDLTRFFDSVEPHKLVHLAVKMEYPLHLLYLGILVHEAPRILEVGGYVSDIIDGGNGILAGCMQAMSWVKIYVYDILDFAHVHYRPVQVKGYVDDITQSQRGTEEEILAALVPAAVHLTHQLQSLGCTISTKSALVASHSSLGKQLAFRIRAAGLPIKLQVSARDLGVMTTAGKKRHTAKLKQRRSQASKKANKVSFLSRIVGRARKLYKPGVLAVGSWSHQVLGLTGGHIQSMRAQAAMCSGWWAPGACTTSVLGLVSAAKDDPQFRLRYEQLMAFYSVWFDLDHKQRMEVAKCWKLVLNAFGKTKHRWQKVRGPMAATIAVLLDLGAVPHSPV